MIGRKSDLIVTDVVKILFRSKSLTCITDEPVQVLKHAINLTKNQQVKQIEDQQGHWFLDMCIVEFWSDEVTKSKHKF